MLLTSAQVSLAISSFIVFFFTTALFLSGYVLQQQTVRDLRAAIAPQLIKPPPTEPDLYLPPQFRDKEYWEAKDAVETMIMAQERAKAEREDGVVMGDEGEDDRMVGMTRWQKKKAREEKRRRKGLLTNGEVEVQKVVGDEEREGLEPSEKEQEDVESKKPAPPEQRISPAERRRRIKEQILAEGEGESFKGYRRRMW